MKSIEELKEFFNVELKKDLETLELDRKKLAQKLILINLLCGLGTGISIILFFNTYSFKLTALIPMVGIIILWVILSRGTKKEYVSNFKSCVIAKIIKFIDPNLNYLPQSCISQSDYMGSGIFPREPDEYRGDDLVYGLLGKTNIRFSELHTEYKTETKNSEGYKQTDWHTIFKGLFFIADFNKNFKGYTLILPDTAQKMFGSLIGNLFQSWNKMRGELIKMEDVEFEKYFVVYGSDQIEARYILSTSLMKRITDFRKKTEKQIYLSFVSNKIFVAIPYHEDLFEPKIFKTLLDFSIIQEYYQDLMLAIEIVEELDLNTRIWVKTT